MLYFLNTNNYLHRSKKFFKNKFDLKSHLQYIINLSKDKNLTDKQIESSYFVIRIDEEKCPYQKIFRQSYKVSDPYDFEYHPDHKKNSFMIDKNKKKEIEKMLRKMVSL